MTEGWKDTFRGREFAFGVNVVNDRYLNFDSVPRRYEHCVDPNTALVSIEVKPSLLSDDLIFQGMLVGCDGTIYLRIPTFRFPKMDDSISDTFTEQVRVPYGKRCEVLFLDGEFGYRAVSLLAENKTLPFVQQQAFGNLLNPLSFRIPESSCVWNVFVENQFSISSFTQWSPAPPYFGWNEYLSDANYTSFAQGGQLDYICRRDPDEVLDRYAVWKISKFIREDLSYNFVGHVCDGPWNGDLMSMSCSGRRVSELRVALRSDSQFSIAINLATYLKNLEHFGLLRTVNETLSTGIDPLSRLPLLTSLDLAQCFLTSLPFEFGHFTSLSRLDLQNNDFTSLPSQIISMASLRWLDLKHNDLTSLPSEIGSLTSLTDLDLQHNQLTSLPSEIRSLTSLTVLDLRSNPLSIDSLPSEIESLASTVRLTCRGHNCTNMVGWSDNAFHRCDWYETYDECEKADGYLRPDGVSANEACCFCGGGTSNDGDGGSIDNDRLRGNIECYDTSDNGDNSGGTTDDDGGGGTCTNSIGFSDIGGDGCDWYESSNGGCALAGAFVNANGISAHEACCICGGGDGSNIDNGDNTGNGDGGGTTDDGGNDCTNNAEWVDGGGDGCDWYEANEAYNACSLALAYSNADGVSANDACCVCGGGTNGGE
mmetsp:Transcript_14969/g.36470  ORF Transcript_14969/g.36470 Transcript_14969/m.36470 type:complete len:652 (+) Transcript_14969:1978-3933(+)